MELPLKSANIVIRMLGVAAAVIVLAALAYFFPPKKNPIAVTPAVELLPSPTAQPEAYQPYANGVYYFPVVGDEYILALEKFYAENPGLHCDYQGNTEALRYHGGSGVRTMTTGFILHCHDIAVPAQEVTIP